MSVYWDQWAVTSEVTLRKVYYLGYIVHQGLHDPDKNETLSIFSCHNYLQCFTKLVARGMCITFYVHFHDSFLLNNSWRKIDLLNAIQ